MGQVGTEEEEEKKRGLGLPESRGVALFCLVVVFGSLSHPGLSLTLSLLSLSLSPLVFLPRGLRPGSVVRRNGAFLFFLFFSCEISLLARLCDQGPFGGWVALFTFVPGIELRACPPGLSGR